MGIIGDSNINPGLFIETREQRQAARDHRIHQATDLIGAQRLDADAIGAHQQTLNRVIDDVSRLRGVGGGVTGGGLTGIFETLEVDRKVHRATQPSSHDNDQAAQIKGEYRDACNEMRRETSQAWRTAQKLGPGTHQMSNGDNVEVTVDPQTMETTVETVSPEGDVKRVTTGNGRAIVEKTSPDGTSSVTRQLGTDIRRFESNAFGETTTDYKLLESGRIARDRSGPGPDDDEHSLVNPDGSTDSRTYVYTDDRGNRAYDERHEPPNGSLAAPPLPDERVPRPFPGPRDSWPPLPDARPPMPLPQPWPEDEGGPTPFPPFPFPPLRDGDGEAPHPWPEIDNDDGTVRLPDGTRIHLPTDMDPNRLPPDANP